MTNVLPISVKFLRAPSSLSLSRWWSPIEGSSRIYSTPTSPDPICVASLIRWDSPPDSVPAARESVRYPSPTCFRNLSLCLISLVMSLDICCSLGVSSRFSKNRIACSTDRSVSSMIFFPPTVTASTVSFSFLP